MTQTDQESEPEFREAGDTSKTGGWWYECCECGQELSDAGSDGGLHLECGMCGHEWYEGEYIRTQTVEVSA